MLRKMNGCIRFLPLFLLFVTLFGCKENNTTAPVEPGPNTDADAITELITEDTSTVSFESNFNEETSLGIDLGKITTQIYPVKVGRKVTGVTRNATVNISGDSAFATVTYTFTCELIIAASHDSAGFNDTLTIDSVYRKPYTTTATRKLIFVRVGNSNRPKNNWKLSAVSLIQGGTSSTNIAIQKLTVYLPSGDSLVITSPNDYYLIRGIGSRKMIPTVSKNQTVSLKVEIFSAFEQDDFVTMTYGADVRGLHRAKRKFNLVSSTPVTGGYYKVYTQSYTTHQFGGYYHAIIDLMPRQVIFDDSTPVESKYWGMPYLVN